MSNLSKACNILISTFFRCVILCTILCISVLLEVYYIGQDSTRTNIEPLQTEQKVPTLEMSNFSLFSTRTNIEPLQTEQKVPTLEMLYCKIL